MADVTKLLVRWREGDAIALEELIPLVYDELRRLASQYLRRERPEHTLQPTALVNEAYVRLAGLRKADFRNRTHFFGAAAGVMRRILVDHARQRRAIKRGDNLPPLDLDEAVNVGIPPRVDFLAVDQALKRLAVLSPTGEKVVELRYFGGLSIDETAAFLDIAPATVKRHWAFARVWLYRELNSSISGTS
jgi:RNA polymerase sigma factor (TIGR02999 family)